MTGDFNIRDSIWDLSFPHHLSFSNDLMIIVDSFNLKLLFPTNRIPIRYSDSNMRLNSVIDLMFLQSRSTEININLFKSFIVKNSEEEKNFVKDISVAIKNINISDLSDHSKIEEITNSLALRIEFAWKTNAK